MKDFEVVLITESQERALSSDIRKLDTLYFRAVIKRKIECKNFNMSEK